ncbi:MAG TPA: glycosyltransferase family 39 protein [Candidatus Polarisedimenticolia bacterium]|nr:glycosyltransferase family 39 protein [Candidatus Polarisedimenticolia bacterium]
MNGWRSRILLPFLLTRGALLLVGLLACHRLVSGLTLQKGNLVYHQPGPPWLDLWARWDSEWYLLIAEQGYRSEPFFLGLPVNYREGDTTGFFPLYPLLIHAARYIGLSSLAAGVLISNLALLAALACLFSLARRDLGEEEASASVWALLAFPTSFFLSAVYAESLMLACLLGSILAARERRPWLAGGVGALCVLSRPTGFLVLVPLFDELVIRRWSESGREELGHPGQGRRAWRSGLAAARGLPPLTLPLVALGGYMVYCHALYGRYEEFLIRQSRWRGPTSGPWRAFVRFFESPGAQDVHHLKLDLIAAVLCVVSIPFLFRALRRSYALYATAAILLPLGSTLWSFSRFAATIFPLHLLLGRALARSPRLFPAYLALALPLLGVLMALYAAWWWAG